jgi:hypothetical protein
MIRLNGFAEAASGFLNNGWSTAAPALQVFFNRASSAFASDKIFTHLRSTVVITSVTVVVLLVVKKLTDSTARSDTVVLQKGLGFKELLKAYEPIIQADAKNLTYAAFVEKHGENAIAFLDEATKSSLCCSATVDAKAAPLAEVSNEIVLAQSITLEDHANALALQLMQINGDFNVFSELFDTTTLAYVTNLEAKDYIVKIAEDAVRNKTITYLQLRPYLDLQSIAKNDPNTEEMQLLRYLFLSFEGRFDDLYEEDRRIFKSETNMYILWCKAVQASRIRFKARS